MHTHEHIFLPDTASIIFMIFLNLIIDNDQNYKRNYSYPSKGQGHRVKGRLRTSLTLVEAKMRTVQHRTLSPDPFTPDVSIVTSDNSLVIFGIPCLVCTF